MKAAKKSDIQFFLAIVVIIAGLVLMFFGFFAVPVGEISASVLTALGECFTFGGSLWGIERTYHYKTAELEHRYQKHFDEDEPDNENKGSESDE